MFRNWKSKYRKGAILRAVKVLADYMLTCRFAPSALSRRIFRLMKMEPFAVNSISNYLIFFFWNAGNSSTFFFQPNSIQAFELVWYFWRSNCFNHINEQIFGGKSHQRWAEMPFYTCLVLERKGRSLLASLKIFVKVKSMLVDENGISFHENWSFEFEMWGQVV